MWHVEVSVEANAPRPPGRDNDTAEQLRAFGAVGRDCPPMCSVATANAAVPAVGDAIAPWFGCAFCDASRSPIMNSACGATQAGPGAGSLTA